MENHRHHQFSIGGIAVKKDGAIENKTDFTIRNNGGLMKKQYTFRNIQQVDAVSRNLQNNLKKSVDRLKNLVDDNSDSAKSNNKLEKDIQRVYENTDATARYVIFYSHENNESFIERMREKYQTVSLFRIESNQLAMLNNNTVHTDF
jgi:gas vesicle protein